MIVIQCAARKRADAGCLRTKDGKKVLFVADPAAAPASSEFVYARPDDRSDTGVSWREVLLRYNRNSCNNPLGLCRAADLYANPAYSRILDRFGAEKTYILSAGWGLIGASLLTPNYDITFSMTAEQYKRRSKFAAYHDLRMLPDESDEPILFFGGKDYVPLFCRLSENARGERTIFYNSDRPPEAPGCSIERFVTRTRTNWHYECVGALLDGKLNLQLD